MKNLLRTNKLCLYKILARQNLKREKYLKNPLFYGREIKKIVQKLLLGARVLLFGSAIRGEYRPDSDFDVLIISNQAPADIFEQAKIKIEILKHFPGSPFEIHLVTPNQFENWYRQFIKKEAIEV